MNIELVTMAPAMEAFTSMYSPARKAVRAITSSVRFPRVALSRPPAASPVLAATDSVAWLSSAASGTIASTDSTKSRVWASGHRISPAKTTGTKTSSHSSGLCRISFSSRFMSAPQISGLSGKPPWSWPWTAGNAQLNGYTVWQANRRRSHLMLALIWIRTAWASSLGRRLCSAQRRRDVRFDNRCQDRTPSGRPPAPAAPPTIRRAFAGLDLAMGEKQLRLGDHLGVAERLVGIALAGLAGGAEFASVRQFQRDCGAPMLGVGGGERF